MKHSLSIWAVIAVTLGSVAAAWFLNRPGDRSASQPALIIAVSVDWEGRDLTDENLQAVDLFHRDLPQVPLSHFLNAAYFTKDDANASDVSARIARLVAPGDGLGLHVHGWRSLFVAAGVEFRDRPRFWGDAHPLFDEGGDVGHEVELSAYDEAELGRVMRYSRDVLAAHGFVLGPTFRAGGWLAAPHVLAAACAAGFTIDSSATSTIYHDEIAGYPLAQRIQALWPAVTETTPPFTIATSAGDVLELPDSCALADYVTDAEMLSHLRAARARVASEERDVFAQVGFHIETAARFAPRVTRALRALEADPAGVPIRYLTLETAAQRLVPQFRPK